MTTITFEENINLPKREFKDVSDFAGYLVKRSYVVELKRHDKDGLPARLVQKMKETKKMKAEEFENV